MTLKLLLHSSSMETRSTASNLDFSALQIKRQPVHTLYNGGLKESQPIRGGLEDARGLLIGGASVGLHGDTSGCFWMCCSTFTWTAWSRFYRDVHFLLEMQKSGGKGNSIRLWNPTCHLFLVLQMNVFFNSESLVFHFDFLRKQSLTWPHLTETNTQILLPNDCTKPFFFHQATVKTQQAQNNTSNKP